MTEIITAEPISRRKALALFGLATAALPPGPSSPHRRPRRRRWA